MKIIGLDVGDRRTGLATADDVGLTARPLETLPTDRLPRRLAQLAAEHGGLRVVVGRPRHLDGSLGEQARRIDALVERLKAAVPAEYVYEDETATTVAGGTDAEAARVMLQGYLDERPTSR